MEFDALAYFCIRAYGIFLWFFSGYGYYLEFCGLGLTDQYLRPEARERLLRLYGWPKDSKAT